MEREHQFELWQIFSAIFLTLWILTSCFDNFFTVFFLCSYGGMILDYLHDFMKKFSCLKKHQFEPLQIFSAVFSTFSIMKSCFDNFFTAISLYSYVGMMLGYLHDFIKKFSCLNKLLSMKREHQFEPWQIFSAIFLTFRILSSCFDNLFAVFFLCIFGGFVTEYLHNFMKNGESKKKKVKKSVNFKRKESLVKFAPLWYNFSFSTLPFYYY